MKSKQAKGAFGLVGLALGAVGAVRELRDANGKRDRLALVNAVVNALAVLTGAALVIRSMRKDGDES
jgi:uncharacterized membrane protein YcjF (UPF0283 family)